MTHESTCPKPDCESTRFEIVKKVLGSMRPLFFVQCAECGAVVGVVESEDFNDRMNQMENNLQQITHRML